MTEKYLTPAEVETLSHMLGLSAANNMKKRTKVSFRNYCCGCSEKFPRLLEIGAVTHRVVTGMCDNNFYHVTDSGIELLERYTGKFKIQHD